MEGVATFSHQQSTIVAWKLAGRAGSVKLHTADATDFILWHIPSPCRDGVPRLYLDFHNCQLLPMRVMILKLVTVRVSVANRGRRRVVMMRPETEMLPSFFSRLCAPSCRRVPPRSEP